MKYDLISNELFITNRKNFAKYLKPKSLSIFNSNDIIISSADSARPFIQHRDIFYLSGIDQEESILLIFPDAKEEKHKEILFLKETSEKIAIWEGAKLSKDESTKVSGISTVYWLDQFNSIFKSLMSEAENVYLNTNEHLRATTKVESCDDRFIRWCKEKYPLHNYKRIAPIMHRLRSVKHTIELQLMQKACDITEKGFRRLLSFIKPGVTEYNIEAELQHEFTNNRANGFAYPSIIASGKSACVLHYVENNKECKDGDILLMDFGAEYANYASDLTRSVPVNGQFTKRQKDVYNAVLYVKKEATKLLTPGLMMNEYHSEVGKIMEDQLLQLGLIDKTDIKNQDSNWPAYKKYFMHGTSHFIGLDTHDVGIWTEPIKDGMCFTVEPGIYILEENLGIRLEDDVVVQKHGEPFNLMKNIPIEADEIEELMNS